MPSDRSPGQVHSSLPYARYPCRPPSPSISHIRPSRSGSRQTWPQDLSAHLQVNVLLPAHSTLNWRPQSNPRDHHAYRQPPQRDASSRLHTAGSPTSRSVYPQSLPPGAPENQRPERQQNMTPSVLYQAHDFVMINPVFIDNGWDNFMSSFLKETIPRAEFDSSDPNMPLRCHPGTRLEIIKRCQDFVLTCHGPQKILWVVGAAGVGKSAIMQSIAQDEYHVFSNVIVGATIFFSINGRQDGTKAIATIAYQLAVKLDSYRFFVQREVTRDPSLLRKSLSAQFKKFIVEPFIHCQILDSSSRLLIIIDGLDECANPLAQQELLGLISFFCVTCPSSPIVWMIASRPEPHITSFFSQPKVALSYEKEEILVDSNDAYEDVTCYLRDMFRKVQMTSIVLRNLPQWPPEGDFSIVSDASGGLFAYASTVVRYICDPTYGDPVSQLDDVLNIIKTGISSNVSGQDHPMTRLDALFAHIMSKIPSKVMENTRKLLLLYAGGATLDDGPFSFNCNMLGMSENAAYGATHHIHSVALVPEPAEAANNGLTFVHKSFSDYLRDCNRSGFSFDIVSEAKQLGRQLAMRILEEAPDGVYMDGASNDDLDIGIGTLKNHPGTRDNISLSWPAADENLNSKRRLYMFRIAVLLLVDGLRENEEVFRDLPSMRVLTTCFARLGGSFPLDAVRDFPFDESRRQELLEHGILKQVSLETIDYDTIMVSRYMRLRVKGTAVEPWNTSCRLTKKGYSRDWTTEFKHPSRYGSSYTCCFERFTNQFKMRPPGHLVTVLDLTAEHRVVEFRFVDSEDGGSEWIYHFFTGKGISYEDGCDGDSDDEDRCIMDIW